MRLIRPGILFSFSLITACATTVPAPREEAPQAVAPEKPLAPERQAKAKRSLEPDVLYQILVAEVAGQRGELGLSSHSYLQAARKTRDMQVARRATHVAIYAKDYDNALKAARLWVELGPEDIEGQQALAALLIRAGHTNEAVAHLEQVLQLSPSDDHRAFLMVANLLGREQDRDQALTIMERLVNTYENNANAQYAYAQLAYSMGKLDKAKASIEQVIATEPKKTDALVLRARILHRQGHNQAAVADFEQALKLSPEDDRLRLHFARLLVDLKDFPRARKHFNVLLERQPNNSDVSYALGLLAIEASDFDEAEFHFLSLLKLGQRSNEAAYSLGQIADSRGEVEEAIKWYSSVADGESYLSARFRVASLLVESQGMSAARAYLAALKPRSEEDELRIYLAEAELLRDAGQYPQAMVIYDEALERFPKNIEVLYARGMLGDMMGDMAILERDLREILKLDPGNAQALNALGYTLADRTDRHEEALELIAKAYEQRPNDAAIIDSMGWVMYQLGRYEEAYKYLKKALSLQQDGEIAAHLGEVLWVMGRQAEARKVWNEASKQFPEHKLLREVMQRFQP